jgi:SAM-dependent methyltransferase
MGHNVTCVEVEKRFIDLIRYRTKDLSKSIEFFNGDMLDFIQDTDKKFDAAIFFESFHHCSEPMKLLKGLSKVIKDDGIVCFASEPLVDMTSDIVPYPWGVRLDGMSLWSIRRFGWMELGFEQSFFLKTLSMYGFDAQKYSSDISPLTSIIIAKKNKKQGIMNSALNTLKKKINGLAMMGD